MRPSPSRVPAAARRTCELAARPLPAPEDLDDATIRAAIARFDGNLSAAARHLGVARNTLYRRMGPPRFLRPPGARSPARWDGQKR